MTPHPRKVRKKMKPMDKYISSQSTKILKAQLRVLMAAKKWHNGLEYTCISDDKQEGLKRYNSLCNAVDALKRLEAKHER